MIAEKLISRFLSLFGEPKSDDPKAVVQEYLTALQKFTPEELDQAANDLIEKQSYKTWPTISECIEAGKRARQRLNSLEGIPAADVKGTGWRISSSSGKKYFRIERGSPEFLEWVKWYRVKGKQDFANTIMHLGYSFTVGPSPHTHGSQQLAFMAQQIGGNA